MMAVHFAALNQGRVEVDVVRHDDSTEDTDSLQYTVALDLHKPVHGGAQCEWACVQCESVECE